MASVTQVYGLSNHEIISCCNYKGSTYLLAKSQDERYLLYSSIDGVHFQSVDLVSRFTPLLDFDGKLEGIEVYKMQVIENRLIFHGLATCLTRVFSSGYEDYLISSFSISTTDGDQFTNMHTPVFRFFQEDNVLRTSGDYRPVIKSCCGKYIYYGQDTAFNAYDPATNKKKRL